MGIRTSNPPPPDNSKRPAPPPPPPPPQRYITDGVKIHTHEENLAMQKLADCEQAQAPNTHNHSFKQLYTGTAWDLLNPDPAKIFMDDITTSLARISRYTGHTIYPVSVLWHSLLVERVAKGDAKPYALLHDVHEAFVGDMISPVKRALSQLMAPGVFNSVWEHLTFKHDDAIWQAFGLDIPNEEIQAEVRRADMVALATEREHLLNKSQCEWGDLPVSLNWGEVCELPDPCAIFSSNNLFRNRAQILCPKVPPSRPPHVIDEQIARGELAQDLEQQK